MPPTDQVLASGNSTKAGLPSSLEEINSRIAEASKDSRFTAAQERKNAELEVKLRGQRDELNKAMQQVGQVTKAKKIVDALMNEYEKEQVEQLSKYKEYCWVCVDMDAFFAAVECLDDPSLKDVPMAVGGSAMLSTANYAARKYGVSAAMPGYIAQKLCPELKIVPLRFDRYKELSGRVAEVLLKYDANLSMWSLDEAFLRLKAQANDCDFGEIVKKMREEVKRETGLTCSAGIACNPFLAKLASNFRKPDGQFEINRQDQMALREFLHEQPVRKLCGLGKVMSLTLERVFDIRTVGDLYEKRRLLPLIFKEKTVKSLVSKSIGHSEDTEMSDSNEIDSTQKSLSCERTFQPNTVDLTVLLEEISKNLEIDLESMFSIQGIGRIGIKVKSADFRVFTREKKINLRLPFSHVDIFNAANGLLNEFLEEEQEIRLLGVRLSGFVSHAEEKKRPNSVLEDWLDDSKAKCPVCSTAFKDQNDLNAVNAHVDECLNKSVLKEILSSNINKTVRM